MKKMIDCPLFDNPVEITHALVAVASQATDNEWGWPSEIPEPRYDQTLMMAAANYIRTLETLLFIHQQFGNDDDADDWLEDWQAFVNRQPDRPAFFAMLEENHWELPRRFRTARYQKWADTERQTREGNSHEL